MYHFTKKILSTKDNKNAIFQFQKTFFQYKKGFFFNFEQFFKVNGKEHWAHHHLALQGKLGSAVPSAIKLFCSVIYPLAQSTGLPDSTKHFCPGKIFASEVRSQPKTVKDLLSKVDSQPCSQKFYTDRNVRQSQAFWFTAPKCKSRCKKVLCCWALMWNWSK